MMKRRKKSISLKILFLVIGLFMAVTVAGCYDTVAADNEAEHLRLGQIAKQQLQYGLPYYNLPVQQSRTFHPTP